MRFLLIFVAVLAALVLLSSAALRKKRYSYWRAQDCAMSCADEPYQPTCSVDTGNTYNTMCECLCHGNTACSFGTCDINRPRPPYRSNHHVTPECREQCAGRGYHPICGEDWLQYDNMCQIRCMGVEPLPGNGPCNNYR